MEYPQVSEQVTAVVEDIEDVELRYEAFKRHPHNDHGYEKLMDSIEDVEHQVAAVEPETAYDELVLNDIAQSLDTYQALADFYTYRSDTTVDEIVDQLHGEDTYDILREQAFSYSQEAEWRATMEDIQRSRVDPRREDVDVNLSRALQGLEQQIQQYAAEHDLISDSFDFNVALLPHGRDTSNPAFWRTDQQTAMVHPNVFTVYEQDGEYILDASHAIHALFEEIFGHGLHQENSGHVAYPQMGRASRRPMGRMHAEAVGDWGTRESLSFMEEYQDVLPVTDMDLDILQDRIESNDNTRKGYSRLLTEQHYRDELEDDATEVYAVAYLDEHPDADRNRIVQAAQEMLGRDMPLTKALASGAYVNGERMIADLEFEQRDPRSVTTGVWTPQVLPDAIDFFEDWFDDH